MQPCEDGVVLLAVRLWDGMSDTCAADAAYGMCVAVVGSHIAWVGKAARLPQSFASLRTVDLRAADATIMPGLIDAHVHLEFDPYYSLHDQPARSADALMNQMKQRCRNMLAHGITSCRDLGGKGSALALRDAIERGECSGPRVLCAGQPITRRNGHCHQWGGAADNEAEMRAVVTRQVDRGADLIKVMATGGVRTAGTSPAVAQYTQAELQATVSAAREAGKLVAAHAHGVSGIGAAAHAGVHTIEHCSWVDASGSWGHFDPAIIDEIARRQILVCPTIHAGWAQRAGMQEAMAPALGRMRAAGVRLVASSDAGAIPNLAHHRLADGLVVLARCAAMSHAEALRAATSDAAAALGIEAECGMLCEGMRADLVAFRGDPIERLEALCTPPLAVISRGVEEEVCAGPAVAGGGARRPLWARAGLTFGVGSHTDPALAVADGLGASALCECNVALR